MTAQDEAILDKMVEIIKTHANYDDQNVSKNDFSILNSGLDTAVIFTDGTLEESGPDNAYMGAYRNLWVFHALIWRRFTYHDETANNLREDVQNVRDTIDQYHRLDNTVEKAFVSGAERITMVTEQGTKVGMYRRLNITVEQLYTPDFLE